MAREINLVPDVKNEMIKALKIRNLLLFVCLIVGAASVAITVIIATSAGIQQYAVNAKKNTIAQMSSKLKSYSDLDEFITIRDQLSDISSITDNKKVMSRTFNILSALIPKGSDSIVISELDVNLGGEEPTMRMTAQANAGEEPFIDYRVLDSFKKSMSYMRYDYGNYVDRNGNIIPAYCMIETNPDGSFLNDGEKGLYAYWLIGGEGCRPEDVSRTDSSSSSSNSTENTESNSTAQTDTYATEDYEGQQVVRIWRTPQFADWYKETAPSTGPYMNLEGQISGVEHFESSCISYKGDDSENVITPKWTEVNETCLLVPDGTDGIDISESSNGRDSNNELVLTFSATIHLSPEVYSFTNTHMIALAPSGRHNVTDSYVQVQAMFGKKASKCVEGDEACNTTPVEQTTEGEEQ